MEMLRMIVVQVMPERRASERTRAGKEMA